ncbi:MAG: hypothetical protein US40_C0003G0068 [Candidatus Roizmanbacteria bacterium GW2011_GWC2_37_13]|uniref:Uncharacterized protein n=1 Tax=Candidatus Roizmanbacteria bacterium GW2011_GWC2_37_13 TaxID=1618486 RepID=A0A0G0JDH1_9BACT|nr:MAG: hypothetical protein US38_C0004G0067 [Candidatus Roizmanbacteria bacterium GW2011_GWC1_37_12]KKQ26216.1 MAG: hypothetical protein US40_C0003G0068 [Candidatus Roizmanbacteria bacterium GW2011_GWC2_37_13]
MDSFNKVISFVLGLVVVLVFFAVVTGRLKLPGKFSSPFSKITIKPTASPTPTPISTVKIDGQGGSVLGNNYKAELTKTPTKPGTIPATGIPTLFIPSLLAGAVGGLFLRKSK